MHWRAVGGCLLVLVALTSCSSGRATQSVPLSRMPAHPLTFGEYRVQGGGAVCRTRVPGAENAGAAKQSRSALPTVSTNLSGATAFWLPGAQGTPCRSVRTAIPAPAARKIAALINAAEPFPAGTVNCGSGDGTQIWLYLRPQQTNRVQQLALTPDGCLTVEAENLWPRLLPETIMRTLTPYAPQGWSKYLHNGV
jgi:hypothetical protein